MAKKLVSAWMASRTCVVAVAIDVQYNRRHASLVLLLCCTPLLFAQADDIRAMMEKSQANWNRGDLAASRRL